MDMTKFKPLEDWLNSLPDPETQGEKELCKMSDELDDAIYADIKSKLQKENPSINGQPLNSDEVT